LIFYRVFKTELHNQDADKIVYARALSRFLDDVAAAEARLGRGILCVGPAFNSSAARHLPTLQQALVKAGSPQKRQQQSMGAGGVQPLTPLADVPITIFSWSNRTGLTNLTWARLQRYCERWGLRFLPLTHALNLTDRDPQWAKVQLAQALLMEHRGPPGIYIWFDDDILLTNLTVDIRVSERPSAFSTPCAYSMQWFCVSLTVRN
jgi:hypothetical protein